jgi:acyl-CoA reductase-like NAD-dependent aldehyde dehydrogenase
MANRTHAGLAAYVFTRDLLRSFRVSQALGYGMLGLNIGRLSSAIAPFGGAKESGIGHEGSPYGMDEYLEMQRLVMEIATA